MGREREYNERLDYIGGICRIPENDFFSLSGFNEEGNWYIAGRISDGEIIKECLYPMRDKKFNFGEFGIFSFPWNTIRDVRRQDIVDKYEEGRGDDSGRYLQYLIAMPCERVWEVLVRHLSEVESITLVDNPGAFVA